jgi:hypothetical protein
LQTINEFHRSVGGVVAHDTIPEHTFLSKSPAILAGKGVAGWSR